MEEYIGLDVSMKETAVAIRRMACVFGVGNAHPILTSLSS
jgi:hypothetical protein